MVITTVGVAVQAVTVDLVTFGEMGIVTLVAFFILKGMVRRLWLPNKDFSPSAHFSQVE
ncbi:hypothetical protein HY417_01755 [Candidatus Kaiserbacteria bacterium]|nr:hypothetical protein [Candidatus Kaiserbacteria bacterium]